VGGHSAGRLGAGLLISLPCHRPPLRGRGRVAGMARPPRRHSPRPQGVPNRRHDAGLGVPGHGCGQHSTDVDGIV